MVRPEKVPEERNHAAGGNGQDGVRKKMAWFYFRTYRVSGRKKEKIFN